MFHSSTTPSPPFGSISIFANRKEIEIAAKLQLELKDFLGDFGFVSLFLINEKNYSANIFPQVYETFVQQFNFSSPAIFIVDGDKMRENFNNNFEFEFSSLSQKHNIPVSVIDISQHDRDSMFRQVITFTQSIEQDMKRSSLRSFGLPKSAIPIFPISGMAPPPAGEEGPEHSMIEEDEKDLDEMADYISKSIDRIKAEHDSEKKELEELMAPSQQEATEEEKENNEINNLENNDIPFGVSPFSDFSKGKDFSTDSIPIDFDIDEEQVLSTFPKDILDGMDILMQKHEISRIEVLKAFVISTLFGIFPEQAIRIVKEKRKDQGPLSPNDFSEDNDD